MEIYVIWRYGQTGMEIDDAHFDIIGLYQDESTAKAKLDEFVNNASNSEWFYLEPWPLIEC